jgi:serine/threonine-protein kinase HipA
MCQALGVMPDLKYQRDGGPGPADIITTIRSVFAGEADVDRFVQALVFNWLIAGTDAHAKNYGLLLSGTNARLAPLYDVASVVAMPEWNWHKWELAMRVNKEARFTYLGIHDWKRFAASARVDFEVIETSIATYASALVDALADAARPMDLDAEERAFVAGLTDAIAEHIARVVTR